MWPHLIDEDNDDDEVGHHRHVCVHTCLESRVTHLVRFRVKVRVRVRVRVRMRPRGAGKPPRR